MTPIDPSAMAPARASEWGSGAHSQIIYLNGRLAKLEESSGDMAMAAATKPGH